MFITASDLNSNQNRHCANLILNSIFHYKSCSLGLGGGDFACLAQFLFCQYQEQAGFPCEHRGTGTGPRSAAPRLSGSSCQSAGTNNTVPQHVTTVLQNLPLCSQLSRGLRPGRPQCSDVAVVRGQAFTFKTLHSHSHCIAGLLSQKIGCNEQVLLCSKGGQCWHDPVSRQVL